MKTKLLLTARDAGAAFSLIEIAKMALVDASLEVTVAAQRPAYDFFVQADIPVELIDAPHVTTLGSEEANRLLAVADELLTRVSPQVVLSGLTTPVDGGIDEAVIARANVPTLVMQDFWGEVNGFFGKTADTYLALDEFAVQLTRERHGVEAVVVGSPRHAPYQELALPAVRHRARAALGIDASAFVFGIFGQALHALPGYHRTLESWADALLQLDLPYAAIYRPHPRESAAEAEHTMALLTQRGLQCRYAEHASVEETLLACDVPCSAFSNCTYEAAYLNRFSPAPLLAPVALFFDPDVTAYFRRVVPFSELPYLSAGLVLAVREKAALPAVLTQATQVADRAALWQAAQALPSPAEAGARALRSVTLAAMQAAAT